jgi:hypothetical protein
LRGGSGAVAAAGWVTVTGTPATKTVAVRVAPELLGRTARATEAETGPEDAAETVIQPGKPETAQGQEAAVWILTVTLPPEAGACNDAGETEYVQRDPDGVRMRMRLFPVSAM